MKTVIARSPLISFFVMAFLFSWIAVLPLILNPQFPVEPFQILGALAGPTLSAVIVIAVVDGRSGLREFFKRYVQWRAGWVWWLIVLFGALFALNTVASIILGASVWSEFLGNIGLVLVTYLVNLVAGIILGPLWEEPGWRGFALPRLQRQYGPLIGTIILGVLWALWHFPGFLGGWMTGGLMPLIVSGIAFSILATWIYNNTRGSILLMILFHSSSNASISVGARVLPTDLSPTMQAFVFSGWIPALTFAAIALIVVIATRGQLSYNRE